MLLKNGQVGILALIVVLAAGILPAAARDTFLTGGGGGGNFRDACGPGQFLTGLSVRSGSWLDSVVPFCATFNAKTGLLGAPGFPMNSHGGRGGGAGGPATCNNQQYVAGVMFGYTQQNGRPKYIASVQLDCVPIRAGDGKGRPTIGAGGTQAHGGVSCGDNQAATGMIGRTGAYVDALGLICGPRPVAAGPRPPPPPPPGPGPKPDAIEAQRGRSLEEQGFNRPGSDYKNIELSSPSPSLCKSSCNREAKCTAWTYVHPGIQGPKAKCWLKTGVPPLRSDKCCVSGLKAGICDAGSRWDKSAGQCNSVH